MNTENKLVKTDKTDAVEETRNATVFTPRVDIYENDEEIRLYADLPGVKDNDVTIDLEDKKLTIEGLIHKDLPGLNVEAQGEGEYLFKRIFSVTKGIDAEKVTAELDRGVLTLHLPKAAPFKVRKIPVSQG